jgi:hypothetical protein
MCSPFLNIYFIIFDARIASPVSRLPLFELVDERNYRWLDVSSE